jgi:hypothetical protein
MNKPPGSLPLQIAPFSTEECQAILNILKGYSTFLQNAPIFPEHETQAERDKRIETLKLVAGRLDQQLKNNPTAIQLPLNPEEVEELIKALLGFVTATKQIVPPSAERDETLSAVDGWRLRLVGYLSAYPGLDALN